MGGDGSDSDDQAKIMSGRGRENANGWEDPPSTQSS